MLSSSSPLQRRSCVVCTDIPTCPVCAADEVCQLTTQSCDSCPKTYCQKLSAMSGSASNSHSSTSGSATGAIIGGVLGGLFAIVVAILLLWWFYIRPRRNKIRLLSNLSPDSGYEKPGTSDPFFASDVHPSQYLDAYTPEMGQNHSGFADPSASDNTTASPYNNRNTTYSVSTTSLTRSSNVIPIAYIPGVTTRSNMDSSSDATNNSVYGRSSIASTDYRGSTAVITAATMTAIQARPNLVDIGSNPTDSTYSDIRASQISDIRSSTYTAVPTFQRMDLMNAHPVTIGKPTGPATTLGLQSQYIQEEDETSTIASESDDDDDTVSGIGANGFPKGINTTSYPGNSTETPSAYIARTSVAAPGLGKSLTGNSPSTPKTLDRPLSGASTIKAHSVANTPQTSDMRPSTDSRANSTGGLPVGNPNAPFSNSSRASQTSSFISYKSAMEPDSNYDSPTSQRPVRNRESATNPSGDDIIDDLPIEALLYAQSEDSNSALGNKKNRQSTTSPFDDKFSV